MSVWYGIWGKEEPGKQPAILLMKIPVPEPSQEPQVKEDVAKMMGELARQGCTDLTFRRIEEP